MIGCGYCPEWYHIDCLGINKSSLNKIKKFKCPVCCLTDEVDIDSCVNDHGSDRASLDEYLVLYKDFEQLKALVSLSKESKRFMKAYSLYKQLDSDISDISKSLKTINCNPKGFDIKLSNEKMQILSNSIIKILGLPFSTSLLRKTVELYRR